MWRRGRVGEGKARGNDFTFPKQKNRPQPKPKNDSITRIKKTPANLMETERKKGVVGF